ncbi:MAG: sugar phosphate nucleotidyltransferase [Candidatus Hodarchaeota archaeon]
MAYRLCGIIIREKIDDLLYKVSGIFNRPHDPPSNLAVNAIYAFSPKIFESLKKIKVDEKSELQLTDAIQYLVSEGFKVNALKFEKEDTRIDIGAPISY